MADAYDKTAEFYDLYRREKNLAKTLEAERDAARAEVERLRGLIYGHRAAVVLQTTARDQDRALWENIERWEADHEA